MIHLEEFVDAAEIDPVFYEKTYFAGPREGSEPYRSSSRLCGAVVAPGSDGSASTIASTWWPPGRSTR